MLIFIISVFVSLMITALMVILFFLPLEGTGILGLIPTRINNFITLFIVPFCLIGVFLSMIAYYMSTGLIL